MSKRFENSVVWITGGGSGIGRAMALEFAREGARVAVSGRRLDRLEETVKLIADMGGEGLAVPCDVCVEDEIESAVETVVAHFGRLDVALANAGYGVSGRIAKLSAEEWRRQMEVNVVGLAMTAKFALPHLLETKGRIAMIGSVAGEIMFPKSGPYCASKAAVRAIAQVLAMECAGTGVSCSLIQPGFVASDIARTDNRGVLHAEREDPRPAQLIWESDRAARVIVRAIHRRKRDFTFTAHGKIAAFFGRHTPGLVHLAITAKK